VVNNFAKSNVSMALLCWLLSTKKVADNTVYISQFKSLDLSFLTQLPMDQIFVLHALIQHDGLESLQVSEVLSFPLQKVKVLLLAMEEDGIIVREKNVFMVHTLVYRTVIQLLKSKNLIY
jgi:predicted transcriptional regulator